MLAPSTGLLEALPWKCANARAFIRAFAWASIVGVMPVGETPGIRPSRDRPVAVAVAEEAAPAELAAPAERAVRG